MLVDVFIEDDESTDLEDQKRQATIKGHEIKTLIESQKEGYQVQIQETFYNPFGKLNNHE